MVYNKNAFIYFFIGFFITSLVVSMAWIHSEHEFNEVYVKQSSAVMNSSEDMFFQHRILIDSIQSFLNTSSEISFSEFEAFTKDLLKVKSAVAFTLTKDLNIAYVSDSEYLNELSNLKIEVNSDDTPAVFLSDYTLLTLPTIFPDMPYLVYAISHQRMQKRMDKQKNICVAYKIRGELIENSACDDTFDSEWFSWFKYSTVENFSETEHFDAYSLKTEYRVPFRDVVGLLLILLMISILGLAFSVLWFFKARNAEKLRKIHLINRSKIAILSSINHEIRTPINALIGYSRILREQTSLSDSQSIIVDKMLWSANLLNSVAENTLNYSKAQTGTLTLNIDRVNVRDYVKRIEQYYQVLSNTSNKYLQVKISDEVPDFVEVDSTKLFQIITNLINNAFKYSSDDRVELHLDMINRFFNAEARSFLRVLIRDFGEGMPNSAKSVLSRPFLQEDSLSSIRGSGIGLGLHTCKGIISLIGGRFWLSSHSGDGTKVLFHFPCRPLAKSPTLSRELVNAPLLLVDDNLFNLEAGKALLSNHQFKPVTVDNAEDALRLKATLSPKIVVVDYRLKEIDGLSLIRQMKKLDEDDSVRYFILSANDKSEILDHELYPYVCFLQKPLNIGLFRSQLMTGCCPACMKT